MHPYCFRRMPGLVVLGLVMPAVLGPLPAVGQETTLALCETPGQAIRIYNLGGQTYLRAYDRKDGIVWMNRTPTRIEYPAEGPRYINLMGEQTVIVEVNRDANGCSIHLGTSAPQEGVLLASATTETEATLTQARELYPEPVAALAADCTSPGSLSVRPFQNEGEPQRARFVCWSPTDDNGNRSGQWLGNLPLTENDPTFINPFTCPAGDEDCEEQLQVVKSRFALQLQQAEFTCSIKDGTLFFQPIEQGLDLRCGYFATTLWDNNGDGDPDYEDPVSVDVSVGRLPMPQ
jgi:hypothetical protein